MAFAPYDDEPLTDEVRAALVEAQEDAGAGRMMSHEAMVRKYARHP
jgi:hypothetical protein